GGMGVVYLVEHEETGGRYAAKVLAARLVDEPAAHRRFQQELRVATRIRAPYVAQVIDAGVSDAVPFLVMELLTGNDLRTELEARGHFAPAELLRLMTQLGRALDDAHGQGIIHRDLKPENLFLSEQGGKAVLKVVDFGLAKLLQSGTLTATGGLRLTATGDVLGTPRYMAPEQAWGSPRDVGPEADRWALGMIVFELLTGQPYFEGTPAEVLAQLKQPAMDPPSALVPGISAAFDAWFGRSCAVDVRGRFDSSREQVLALARALGLGVPTSSGSLDRPVEIAAHPRVSGLASFEGGPNPTPAPHTPAPHTPAPHTPAPHTPAPHTPAPHTPAPYTPAPHTPAPHTPAPFSPAWPASTPPGTTPANHAPVTVTHAPLGALGPPAPAQPLAPSPPVSSRGAIWAVLVVLAVVVGAVVGTVLMLAR
ncbi:MAG: serine/threonine protein kinase, partial [Myxococcales bacterium]|nr:serine/threonine protein kinase [Myxococcales bacterium]